VSAHPVLPGALHRLLSQAGRFAAVGVVNTLVDLLAFNLLWWLFRPAGPGGIALSAALAALLATVNSYVLNAGWTFSRHGSDGHSLLRFAGVALLGIGVQTGVALFVAHRVLAGVGAEPVLLANIAKLAAVCCAFLVTFAGYRLAVFTPRSLLEFRDRPVLGQADGPVPASLLAALLLVGLAARLAFLAVAPVAYGDAVSYSWVAWAIGHGRSWEADPFWHSLFDYWQALFVWAGLDQYPALVLASLIPGIALIVPTVLLGWTLYGRNTAVLAGLAVALHPRLIEYSVNGYAESFFLHAALWAVWGATTLIAEPRRRMAAVALGSGAAAWMLVRNEAVLIILVLFLTPWVLRRPLGLRAWLPAAALTVLSGAVVAVPTLAVDTVLFGQPQLLAKATNASRQHVEMLDPVAAARETYRLGTEQATQAGEKRSRLDILLERWPQNVRYTLERLPGMLLSPLFLAALLLPALTRRRGGGGREWPLLAFTVWPLLFYPLLQLEPRMLLPTVIGCCLFGAAGLVVLGRFIAERLRGGYWKWVPAAATMLLLGLLILPLGLHSERERGPHRAIGAWVAASVPESVSIYGDGYGYVSSTSFWAGRRAEPRPWTNSGEQLADWLNQKGPAVLILYDGYRRQFNPDFAGLSLDGAERLEKAVVLPFHGNDRVVVWANHAALGLVRRPEQQEGPGPFVVSR